MLSTLASRYVGRILGTGTLLETLAWLPLMTMAFIVVGTELAMLLVTDLIDGYRSRLFAMVLL